MRPPRRPRRPRSACRSRRSCRSRRGSAGSRCPCTCRTAPGRSWSVPTPGSPAHRALRPAEAVRRGRVRRARCCGRWPRRRASSAARRSASSIAAACAAACCCSWASGVGAACAAASRSAAILLLRRCPWRRARRSAPTPARPASRRQQPAARPAAPRASVSSARRGLQLPPPRRATSRASASGCGPSRQRLAAGLELLRGYRGSRSARIGVLLGDGRSGSRPASMASSSESAERRISSSDVWLRS